MHAAEKQWKRKYFHEKKLSSSMEEKIKQLKAEYYHRIQQNKVDEQLQFEFNKGITKQEQKCTHHSPIL